MQDFDRISFRCRECSTTGVIQWVAVNLTRVVLHGVCLACMKQRTTTIDLHQVDHWLHDEAAMTPAGMTQ
jgi:hypothetical protein